MHPNMSLTIVKLRIFLKNHSSQSVVLKVRMKLLQLLDCECEDLKNSVATSKASQQWNATHK
jgi:hypothetical protein